MLRKHKALLGAAGLLAAVALASPAPAGPPRRAQQQQQQAAAAATPAAAAPATGTLASIDVSGSKRFPPSEIVADTGLTVGQQVTKQAMQAAANRLAKTGLFSSVNYRFTSQGVKVAVAFQVADARTLPVAFDNFPWFTEQELDQIIRQKVGLFDGTAPESGSYDDQIGAAIEDRLSALGVSGRVEHRLIPRLVGSGMEVEYRLVGPTMNVGAVEFTDPLAQHDERVQDRLQDLVGKPFSRYFVNVFVDEQVRPIYLSQGYLRVEFGPPEARFTGNPNAGSLSSVQVIVPVTRGPQIHWAGATWSGNTVFTASALDRLLGLQPGATADGLAIEAGWQKIREGYGAKGYLDTALDPEPTFDNAKATVAYHVNVSEGKPYRMGKLVIDGLAPEAERRVRGAWKIGAGKTFDLSYFQAFVGGIAKESLGDLPVHYQHIGRFLDRHPQQQTVDVLLDFR